MVNILDAHALLTFFEKEEGYDKVKSIFLSASEKEAPLLMTCVNYGEVLYIVLRECGAQKEEEIEKVIRTLPIELVEVDRQLAREAAQIKAHFKLSYADCFAAALSRLKKGQLITGDREFNQVKDIINILWT